VIETGRKTGGKTGGKTGRKTRKSVQSYYYTKYPIVKNYERSS